MKISKIQEFKNDRGTFRWMMEFIDICHEHDLNSKSKVTIDAYNNAVLELDKLATKYNLHNNNKRSDAWYELHYLWPKMSKFFNEKGLDYMFDKALDELWWYSDQNDPMCDFCNFIEEFANDMKGYAKAKVINLAELGFKCRDIYIAYDGSNDDGTIVLNGGDFIKYIKNTMDTLDSEYKEIWAKEIFKIVEKYE